MKWYADNLSQRRLMLHGCSRVCNDQGGRGVLEKVRWVDRLVVVLRDSGVHTFGRFDLVLSSIEPLVEEFRRRGLRAELMHHAFDGRVLSRIAPSHGRRPRVAFVGNLTRDHRERIRFLDEFSRRVELDFYGLGVELLPLDSPMRARWVAQRGAMTCIACMATTNS